MPKFPLITIDPGLNIGVAVWVVPINRKIISKIPLVTFVSKPTSISASWERRMVDSINHMEKQLRFCNSITKPTIIIEAPEFFESELGFTSARKGDLCKLSMSTGMIMESLYKLYRIMPKLITAKKWKGQLPKKVVEKRIQKITGKVYPNHICDAVGIGLHYLGVF